MPEKLPKEALAAAEAAVSFAAQVRRHHARRTPKKSKQRERDIELALRRLKIAMRPLKTEIGRFAFGPQTDSAEANRNKIREASLAIQAERRKLWKMRSK